jgi:polyferredoxin
VLAIETIAHALLVLEVWVLLAALGLSFSWSAPLIVEGGVKFIAIAFAFIPGQFGASESVYVLIAGAVGLPVAAGLTLALVRRVRGLFLAAGGLLVLVWFGSGETVNAGPQRTGARSS